MANYIHFRAECCKKYRLFGKKLYVKVYLEVSQCAHMSIFHATPKITSTLQLTANIGAAIFWWYPHFANQISMLRSILQHAVAMHKLSQSWAELMTSLFLAFDTWWSRTVLHYAARHSVFAPLHGVERLPERWRSVSISQEEITLKGYDVM